MAVSRSVWNRFKLALFLCSFLLEGCAWDLAADGASSNAPTTVIRLVGNLDAREVTTPGEWDAQSPGETARLSAAVSIRDLEGRTRQLTFYFRRVEVGRFDYFVLAPGEAVHGGRPGINDEVGSGTLSFDGEGQLQGWEENRPLEVRFADTKQSQRIELDLNGSGNREIDAGLTQYALPTSITQQGDRRE